MSESYLERMDRITRNAELLKEKYANSDGPSFLIAGKFTLEEMMGHRQFYKECGELFVCMDKDMDIDKYYPNCDDNLTEFFTFLLLSESDIYKFLIDKMSGNNFAK